jgi:hypothetical protein
MSSAAVEKIEEQASLLHYPFYVVLIRGDMLPGSGSDGDLRLQDTTDELMVAWNEQGMDASRYSVFAVAWGDDCDKPPSGRSAGTICKYFLNTGSEFIHGPADFLPSRDHESFTSRFRSKVATSPQDPAGGIQDVMASVDEMLWSRTNPEELARQAKQNLQAQTDSAEQLLSMLTEAEQATVADSLATAATISERGDTDEIYRYAKVMSSLLEPLAERVRAEQALRKQATDSLVHLRRLLDTEPALLPEDVQPYEAIISAGEAILAGQESGTVESVLERAVVGGETLSAEISDNRVAARARAQLRDRLIGGGLLFGLGLFIFVGRRRSIHDKASTEYDTVSDLLGEKLSNAAARYTSLELDDREELVTLSDTSGQTQAEQAAVTAELDDIYAGIRALESHLARCDAAASAAGLFSVDDIDALREELNTPFDYDTGELQEDQLFGGETKIIQIDPAPFMAELQDRFAQVVTRRKALIEVAGVRFSPASEQLAHSGLDDLLARADHAAIPARWLSDHALFGDNDADETLYESLDAIRIDDPLVYLQRIQVLRAEEASISERTALLEGFIEQHAAACLDTLPPYPDSIMRLEDDPSHTLRRAQALSAEARGILAATAETKDIEIARDALQEATAAYVLCQEQAAAIAVAVEATEPTLEASEGLLAQLMKDLDMLSASLPYMASLYVRTTSGRTWTQTAEGCADAARGHNRTARQRLDERRHLDASRCLGEAERALQEMQENLQKVRDLLDDMSRQRTRYLERVEKISAIRAEAEKQLKRYSGTADLAVFTEIMVADTPNDYSQHNITLDQLEEGWNTEVRSARTAHEAREKAKKEAAEQARRAAAAARRSTASSTRSSFSSSSRSSRSSYRSSSSSRRSSSSSRRSRSSSSSRRSSGGGSSYKRKGSSGGGGGW